MSAAEGRITNVFYVLGDDDDNGQGFTEQWAVGDFTVSNTPVPEPFTILGSIAALGFGAKLRKKLRGAETAE